MRSSCEGPTPDPCAALLGAWSLISLRRFRNDRFFRHPMGEDATGRLIYCADGIMAAFLMSAAWARGEAKPDWSTFLSYSGRWRIVNGDTVIHDVDAASISALIGRPLERIISHPSEGMLMLRTEGHIVSSGESSHDELIWKRM